MERTAFTREEVINMMVSMFLFSNANGNQGLSRISGQSFGEQAETVIRANEAIIGTDKTIISTISYFTK